MPRNQVPRPLGGEGTGGLLPALRLWAFCLQTTGPFQPSARAGQVAKGGTRPQLWSGSSCEAKHAHPRLRLHGRGGARRRGAGSRRTGEARGQGVGVREPQDLHESVHTASGPQRLGCHEAREVSPQAAPGSLARGIGSHQVAVPGRGSARWPGWWEYRPRGLAEPGRGGAGCRGHGRQHPEGRRGRAEPTGDGVTRNISSGQRFETSVQGGAANGGSSR